MFSLLEVIFLLVVVSGFVAVVAYRYAEFKIITRLLSTLTEQELDRLEEIKDKLDAATSEEEADAIIEEASKAVNLKMLKQEVIDGMVFFYDLKGNFVCQGPSLEHAVVVYELNNKSGTNACVIDEMGKKFYIIDGKIQSTLPL